MNSPNLICVKWKKKKGSRGQLEDSRLTNKICTCSMFLF